MKTLVVRADAGARLGNGHFMRCLALAQAWRARGGEAVFLSRVEGSALPARVEEAGMRFVPLPEPHPHPGDLRATLELLAAAGEGAALAIDGYFFTPEYHAAVRAAGHPLLVVDDTAHLDLYHADVLLNQNLGAERLPYRHDPDTVRLLGPRHALLRPEFAAGGAAERATAPRARRVLVTLGGGDPDNVTARVVRALCGGGFAGAEVAVVVGSSNPHRAALEAVVEEACGGPGGPAVRLLADVRNMPALMSWAEMAVSAGGSTCWELACLGLPAVVLTLADNQRGIAEALGRAGAALPLGWHEQVEDGELAAALRALAADPERRRRMSAVQRGLVDGRGAARVAEALWGRGAARGAAA